MIIVNGKDLRLVTKFMDLEIILSWFKSLLFTRDIVNNIVNCDIV